MESGRAGGIHKKSARSPACISGSDYDLKETGADGKPVVRQITIKDKSWGTFDNGKTWKSESADDRSLFNVVDAALAPDRMKPAFETVGTEKHGSETWLHIRLKQADPKPQSDRDVWQYWLLMDKDSQPVSVRRFAGYVLMQGNPVVLRSRIHALAEDGAAIDPPKNEKAPLFSLRDFAHGFCRYPMRAEHSTRM